MYFDLKQKPNKGYLYKLSCERSNKKITNCKMDTIDTFGKKVTAFSAPIKSAYFSVITTRNLVNENVYTCYISFLKRDGARSNIPLFTTIENSRRCPKTQSTVKQINQYILGKGNKPLGKRYKIRRANQKLAKRPSNNQSTCKCCKDKYRFLSFLLTESFSFGRRTILAV